MGIRDVQIMRLSTSKFCENRQREGHTFRVEERAI